MNIFRKLMNRVFDRQYVVLVHIDNDMTIRRAYELGGSVYANPYSPSTRTELLPGGKVNGQGYIVGWKPITDKTIDLYEQDN